MKVKDILAIADADEVEVCWSDERGLMQSKPSWAMEPHEFDDETVTGIFARPETECGETVAVLSIEISR